MKNNDYAAPAVQTLPLALQGEILSSSNEAFDDKGTLEIDWDDE